ncbi:MAG: YqgE/AlgH family protein, partial [Kutzneria sp.]|nr:YqgE/AlgH family protein [Kutzneria sp.]
MAGVRHDRDVEPGSLLVAAPNLLDSNFRRTVVYIIDHRGECTLGVVL